MKNKYFLPDEKLKRLDRMDSTMYSYKALQVIDESVLHLEKLLKIARLFIPSNNSHNIYFDQVEKFIKSLE